jgi:epoxyqueuosine reductase QueG
VCVISSLSSGKTAPGRQRAVGLELQRHAEDLGFVVSWAPVELPDRWKESYHRWIQEGRNAGLGQLARALEVRLDPRIRFAWAQSVMLLGAPHAYPDPGAPDDGLRIGRVSRRFWVREPEPFALKRLLEPSIEALKSHAAELDVRCRDYLDQGPLPINLYAVLSGRYWRGRNAMPLDSVLGTRVTFACLLTDLPLDKPAAPHPDRCGSCRSCVSSCPTGALLEDRRIDLNRCISYWTTSHEGLVPAPLWDSIGDWLLGCDICQDVCPWNARPDDAGTAWSAFKPDPELAHPNIADLIELAPSDFAERYAGSAFERLGRGRIVRNALIVLASSGRSDAVALIDHAAGDADPLVRATAARALVRSGRRATAQRLAGDPDPRVREELQSALAQVHLAKEEICTVVQH